MGRTEPSQGLAPPSFRRDARAKRAKATINKVIPAIISAHPRAKRGADSSELIVDPPVRKPAKSGATVDGNGSPGSQVGQGPKVMLQVCDTLAAAHSLLRNEETGKLDLSNKEARVAILNMASPLSPGGGFVNGASSQEETLCMRSTLLLSLKDEFYRLPEVGAIYTPDVLVFRDTNDEDLDKAQRWFVDCVSAAMLRMPETEADDDTGHWKYSNDGDRALVLQKMRILLRILQSKGAKQVVLGAWGCGAYGNPVAEIAKAWQKVLIPGKNKKETWEGIERVVFAITDQGLADGFERAFGEGLTREHAASTWVEGSEDDAETSDNELNDKIQELESRIELTQNPQLKRGLIEILAGLRQQASNSVDGASENPKCTERHLKDTSSGEDLSSGDED